MRGSQYKQIVDKESLMHYLSRSIKKEMLMRDLQGKEVAMKAGVAESYLSGVLGTRPTNNKEVYRKIALAIGLKDSEFEKMVQDAQQEAFGGGDVDFDYALSSKYGDTPEAMQELKNFADFVDQKYGIKK